MKPSVFQYMLEETIHEKEDVNIQDITVYLKDKTHHNFNSNDLTIINTHVTEDLDGGCFTIIGVAKVGDSTVQYFFDCEEIQYVKMSYTSK